MNRTLKIIGIALFSLVILIMTVFVCLQLIAVNMSGMALAITSVVTICLVNYINKLEF